MPAAAMLRLECVWVSLFAALEDSVVDIVVIHGIFVNRSDRATMCDEWRSALVKGLQDIRFGGATDIDLECAFYGHLYNDGKSFAEPAYRLSDLNPGLEQDMLLELAEETEDSAVATGKFYAPQALQAAMRAMGRHRVFDGATGILLRLIKQVGRYFSDPYFMAQAWNEFQAAVETKPRLIIAHSLGSVIAYDWLRSHPPTSATTLVTIGSPLGLRCVRKALHLQLNAGPGPWPEGIATWVNVAAEEDAVAAVKELDGLFAGKILDRAASNSRRTAHSATSYLKNLQTARAVAAALD